MNSLDIVVLIIIGAFLATGLWKGLVKQLFSLAGIIVGYVVAINYYELISQLFSDLEKDVASAISFIGIFVICIIISSIVGLIVGKLIKIVELNWLNRVAGGLLGILKGLLIVIVIVVILVAFLPADGSILENSVTLPFVMSATRVINDVIPQHIKDKYKNKFEEIETNWLQKELKKQLN